MLPLRLAFPVLHAVRRAVERKQLVTRADRLQVRRHRLPLRPQAFGRAVDQQQRRLVLVRGDGSASIARSVARAWSSSCVMPNSRVTAERGVRLAAIGRKS